MQFCVDLKYVSTGSYHSVSCHSKQNYPLHLVVNRYFYRLSYVDVYWCQHVHPSILSACKYLSFPPIFCCCLQLIGRKLEMHQYLDQMLVNLVGHAWLILGAKMSPFATRTNIWMCGLQMAQNTKYGITTLKATGGWCSCFMDRHFSTLKH